MSEEDIEKQERSAQEHCANCGTPLDHGANFCPNCGQDVKNKVVPIRTLAGDVVRDTLGLESKFFHSIPKLLFRPGYLTNQFVQGKRATYIPAIRMYIFISIVAFLIFSINTGEDLPDNVLTDPQQTAALLDSLDSDVPQNDFDVPIDGLEFEADTAELVEDFDVMVTLNGIQVDNMTAFKKKMEEVGFEEWMEQEMPDQPVAQFFMRQMMKMYKDNGWQQVNQNIERNLSVMMFFLIPFFALLMKLFLWRSYYVVHLIFCFHLVSFFFIEMSIFELLDIYVLSSIDIVGLVLFLVYFFLAIKNVYLRKWWANVLLTLAFLVLFVASTGVFVIVTSLISLALY